MAHTTSSATVLDLDILQLLRQLLSERDSLMVPVILSTLSSLPRLLQKDGVHRRIFRDLQYSLLPMHPISSTDTFSMSTAVYWLISESSQNTKRCILFPGSLEKEGRFHLQRITFLI